MQWNTLGVMVETKSRAIRFPDDLWDGFGLAVQSANNGMTRAAVIRQLIKWWMRVGPAPPLPPSKNLAIIGTVNGEIDD
jgi:hypothetical protein